MSDEPFFAEEVLRSSPHRRALFRSVLKWGFGGAVALALWGWYDGLPFGFSLIFGFVLGAIMGWHGWFKDRESPRLTGEQLIAGNAKLAELRRAASADPALGPAYLNALGRFLTETKQAREQRGPGPLSLWPSTHVDDAIRELELEYEVVRRVVGAV